MHIYTWSIITSLVELKNPIKKTSRIYNPNYGSELIVTEQYIINQGP